MVQPNAECVGFCNWMLNISAQRLSGPQRVIVSEVFNAAVMNTPISDQDWYNFNLFSAWRNRYYLVYRDYAQVVAPGLLTGLISSYNLDGNSNDPVVGNNGTDSNILYSLLYGKINEGANFNGINSQIQIGAITPGVIFSVGLWMKTAPIGTGIEDIITGGATPEGLTLNKVTNILRWYDSGFNNFTTPLIPGTWYCIVITSDGSTLNLYLNGNLNATYSLTTAAPYLQSMGTANFNAFYEGDMDIVNFWQRALTASDVLLFYNSGSGIQYPF